MAEQSGTRHSVDLTRIRKRRPGLAGTDSCQSAVVIWFYERKGEHLRCEIRQMIAAEENETDRDALTLSREKCLEQIELLQRQKVQIEEGLSELHRIYKSLSGKLDQRPG